MKVRDLAALLIKLPLDTDIVVNNGSKVVSGLYFNHEGLSTPNLNIAVSDYASDEVSLLVDIDIKQLHPKAKR